MLSRRTFLALPGISPFVDWPQWRGPKRDGSVVATLPKVWPEKLRRVWSVLVGEGHSSPVVVGKSVFQFARMKDRETITCLNLDSGKAIWSQSYSAPYEINPSATTHGKGPKATPVVGNGRVYTLGIGGILSCWDANTGKKIWSAASPFNPDFGHASSPLLDSDTLISELTAYDAASGKVKWQRSEDGIAYSSPMVISAGGGKQVVTMSRSHIVGIDFDSGRSLWQLPLRSDFDQNAVTPLPVGDLIVFSALNNPLVAIRPGPRPQKIWENREVGMYMSSPVEAAGVLWGLTNRNKGQFFGVDPKSGKTVWTGEGRQAENAVLVSSGSTVFALTTQSQLIVLEASSRALKEVRRYNVADSPTWAHPAVLGTQMLVKDANSLLQWSAV